MATPTVVASVLDVLAEPSACDVAVVRAPEATVMAPPDRVKEETTLLVEL